MAGKAAAAAVMGFVLSVTVDQAAGAGGAPSISFAPGVEVEQREYEEGMQGWQDLPGSQLVGVPGFLKNGRHQAWVLGEALPAGTAVTFRCPADAEGEVCNFYAFAYRCPPCDAQDGGLQTALVADDWTPSSCAPHFRVEDGGAKYKMVGFRKQVAKGDETSVTTTKEGRFIGFGATGAGVAGEPWCPRPVVRPQGAMPLDLDPAARCATCAVVPCDAFALCHRRGTCTDDGKGCVCGGGWTGPRCETHPDVNIGDKVRFMPVRKPGYYVEGNPGDKADQDAVVPAERAPADPAGSYEADSSTTFTVVEPVALGARTGSVSFEWEDGHLLRHTSFKLYTHLGNESFQVSTPFDKDATWYYYTVVNATQDTPAIYSLRSLISGGPSYGRMYYDVGPVELTTSETHVFSDEEDRWYIVPACNAAVNCLPGQRCNMFGSCEWMP